MYSIFEESDSLNTPIECFYYGKGKNTFPVRKHWHYFMEIIYMLSGNAKITIGDETKIITTGEMAIIYPETDHSIYAVDDEEPVYAVLKFDINRMNMALSYAPKLRSIYSWAKKKKMSSFLTSEQTESMFAKQIFVLCIDEVKKCKYGFDAIINAEIYKLLISIIRLWQEKGFIIDNDVFAEDSQQNIYNITGYIDENLTYGLKVSDIAEKCSMSYSHFAKKFLSVYGKTCKQYIEEMRVFKVEEFLNFTDFDLNYIAQETGFSDCSHMIKSFKRQKAITPKQYRLRQNKINNK